jgi:prepilin-type N-terminal cleavage/methylation domain-containing protein
MSLKNIKSKTQAQSGFTIVELLIVVVVIAILAAITIVSYNGITARANTSAAAAAAATVQKKAELYAADGPTNKYPTAFTDLTNAPTVASDTFYLTGVKNAATAPIPKTGTDTIQYLVCGRGSATTKPTTISAIVAGSVTGGQVNYYDFTAGTGFKSVSFGQSDGTIVIGASTYTVGCAAS